MYIRSASAVSPQASFNQMLSAPAVYTDDKLHCIEPDYSKYIDSKLIRRMSRIIKMGVAAALEALKDAEISMPDAIVTGTAYGCLADTDAFLSRMVEFNEELLSPTSFIQSTHNTVGAQIALMLQCHHYNNTYVHRGSSFEAAVLDAQSLIEEGEAENILVGAVDEIIENSHTIISRLGIYKKCESNKLLNSGTDGTMAGEGASFFVFSKNKDHNSIAKLEDVKTYYKTSRKVENIIQNFLMENNVPVENLDLIILGNNGDAKTDEHFNTVAQHLFGGKRLVGYKNYCGEYPTSAAFALWMATMMIEHGKKINNATSPKKILIYNNYKLKYPSLYLLSAC